MSKIIGYFMETGIFSGNTELPPRRNNIILIGDKPTFHLEDYEDNDEIPVLSENGNWYTIKKSEIKYDNE